MKEIAYYDTVDIPYKTKKDFTDKVEIEIEKFVGTKSEIKAKEKEFYDIATAKFKAYFINRQLEINKKHNEFKNDLAVYHGVANNSKLDKLWDIAWDYGHSYGLSEVRIYFETLVELIN